MNRVPVRSARSLALLLALVSSIAAAAPAALHLALSKAEPGVDSTIAASPAAVALHFNQAPQAGATSINLMTAAHEAIPLAKAEADAADAKVVRAALTRPLAPGSYMVAWRTMARDGHVIRGEYRFTFKPAT